MVIAGTEIELAQVVADTVRRDKIDSERDAAPLRIAYDATVIHTDGLSLEEVVESIVSLVEQP